jgi:hypothetical protein
MKNGFNWLIIDPISDNFFTGWESIYFSSTTLGHGRSYWTSCEIWEHCVIFVYDTFTQWIMFQFMRLSAGVECNKGVWAGFHSEKKVPRCTNAHLHTRWNLYTVDRQQRSSDDPIQFRSNRQHYSGRGEWIKFLTTQLYAPECSSPETETGWT